MNELWIMLGLLLAATGVFWVLARFRLL